MLLSIERMIYSPCFLFIKKKYGKTPRFSPLSTRNVKESQKETFKTMYRKMPDDLIEGKDLDAITENLHPYTSGFMEMVKFANALFRYSVSDI